MKKKSQRGRGAQQQPAAPREASREPSEEELSRFESEGGRATREPEEKGAPVDSHVSKSDRERQ